MSWKYKNNNGIFLSIAAATVLFFAVNIIGNASFKKYGIDFTEGRIYALSNGTESIIKKIPEPITLKFFYSKRASNGFPFLKNYAERIGSILQKYAGISNKIKLQVIDPEPFTDNEDLAVAYGIKGVELPNSNEKLYLGLVISNGRDDTRTIPFFHPDRQRFLEYEITKAIYDLSQQRRPVIGLLSTLPVESTPLAQLQGYDGQALLILQQLRQSFDIETLNIDTAEIPRNIDVLMLVQPKDLSTDTLNAIDQYVLAGGRTMVFADPNAESTDASNNGFSSDFNKLLAAWGIEIPQSSIIADRKAARPVSGGNETTVDYIAWLNIEQEGLNKEDVTTSLLKNINLATSGYIKNLQAANLLVTPLIKTSNQSMQISKEDVSGTPDPNKMLSNFKPDNVEYILAARIEGEARTAFPERVSEPGHLEKSTGNINLVVIADTDILQDSIWAQIHDMQGYKIVSPNGDNNSFVTNVAELLSGNNDIISLRGRGSSSRNFDVVEKLKRRAEEHYLQKEKELKEKLSNTEKQLAELKKQAEAEAGNNLAYRSQQRDEINKFTEQMVLIKKDLRNVQRELKSDVESLGSILKFINIILLPIMIGIFALVVFRARK